MRGNPVLVSDRELGFTRDLKIRIQTSGLHYLIHRFHASISELFIIIFEKLALFRNERSDTN